MYIHVFIGAFTEKLEDNQVRVERRIFASQEYTELLITYVIVTRLGSTGLCKKMINTVLFSGFLQATQLLSLLTLMNKRPASILILLLCLAMTNVCKYIPCRICISNSCASSSEGS